MPSDIPILAPKFAALAAKREIVDLVDAPKTQTEPRPRSRRKTPKVKTGCFTCRARRVKCDESKPICKKCHKFNISCSYPVSISQKQKPKIRQLHPLIPKERPVQSPLSLRGYEVKAGPRFTDENEARYFVYYCEGMSKQIGGPFGNKLWDQMIPQAGEGVPFIGRAVIALGALSKSKSLSFISLHPESERESHSRYALSQYVQALKGMRKSISENPKDVRTALIGCLLVFCFESLQGHQGAASLHASSGVDLITNMCTHCQPKAWRNSELGAELYSALSSLNLQSLLFVDRRKMATHQFYKTGLGAAASSMPNEFTDLDECRRFWHYLMRRNLHFTLEVRDSLTTQHHSFDPTLTPTSPKFPELGINNGSWTDHTPSLSPTSSPLLAERDLYVQDICRWEIASAPLLCRLFSQNEDEGEEFLIACLLRIHAAMNIVLLTRAFNPSEMEYDKFIDQFRTVVDLSERIHHLLVGEGTFRFEIGILPALSQATLLCREIGFRGRAIALLKGCRGYKEGIWDAEGVGAVGEWVRGLEEEGLGDGEVVEEGRRVQLVGCDMKVDERWASVRVRQGDGMEREGVVGW